jgi:hypothetical protein
MTFLATLTLFGTVTDFTLFEEVFTAILLRDGDYQFDRSRISKNTWNVPPLDKNNPAHLSRQHLSHHLPIHIYILFSSSKKKKMKFTYFCVFSVFVVSVAAASVCRA